MLWVSLSDVLRWYDSPSADGLFAFVDNDEEDTADLVNTSSLLAGVRKGTENTNSIGNKTEKTGPSKTKKGATPNPPSSSSSLAPSIFSSLFSSSSATMGKKTAEEPLSLLSAPPAVFYPQWRKLLKLSSPPSSAPTGEDEKELILQQRRHMLMTRKQRQHETKAISVDEVGRLYEQMLRIFVVKDAVRHATIAFREQFYRQTMTTGQYIAHTRRLFVTQFILASTDSELHIHGHYTPSHTTIADKNRQLFRPKFSCARCLAAFALYADYAAHFVFDDENDEEDGKDQEEDEVRIITNT